MVEIDRGTMPIVRSYLLQTSFERKMRAYLAAPPMFRSRSLFSQEPTLGFSAKRSQLIGGSRPSDCEG